jgi:hypothetical protein
LKIGLEESGLTDRTRTKGGETRAQFVKRLLDRAQAIAEGYEFVEVRKPKGAEDVCWKELNDPPEGGLANTYLANEKYISIHIGFYEGERQPDGMRIVESDGVDIWIGLYEDVNV